MNVKSNKHNEQSIMKETIDLCKILYCNKDLPIIKTHKCNYWECNIGWHNILKRLSCELEALNLMYYDKYKVRIQADQIKEKFGTLRFYYSVVCDNYTEDGLEAIKIINEFEEKKDNDYFGLKYIVDENGYETTEVDKNGKEYKLWHVPKGHYEIDKHAYEYEQMTNVVNNARRILYERGHYDLTSEQQIIIEFLENEAEIRIHKAEEDCYITCEFCGSQIGTDYSPRCETDGWIKYICKDCAEKIDSNYYLNGELWNGKTRLLTAKEVKAKYKKS